MDAAGFAVTLVYIDAIALLHGVSLPAGTGVGSLGVGTDVVTCEESTWEVLALQCALVQIGTESKLVVLLVSRLALTGVGTDGVDAFL